MRPSKLLGILAVPGTNEDVALRITKVAGGEPHSGWLEDAAGNVVGRLERYRFDFVSVAPVDEGERALARSPITARVRESARLSPFSSRLDFRGTVFSIQDYLRGIEAADPASRIRFSSSASALRIHFHAHAWSGYASIFCNGSIVAELDLFNLENSVPRPYDITLDTSACKPNDIEIRASAEINPSAFGRQIIIEGITEFGDEWVEDIYEPLQPRNHGANFHPDLLAELNNLGSDGVCLDIGGGKRVFDDPRYLNLEYSRYDEPSIFGSALALPFKDNSIDLAYSAAVLEHVRDPLKMGAEIHRVLRTGGKVIANSAFMQPVHSEGQHFFNLTPYGIELVFAKFGSKKISWEGNLTDLFDWAIDVAKVSGALTPIERSQFTFLSRKLDAQLTYERLMYVASGVWVRATK